MIKIEDEPLSKAELQFIERIVGALGLSTLKTRLWSKVRQAFNFTNDVTQIEYGFERASPDQLALDYLEERAIILSDKTKDNLTGDIKFQLLEGMRNTESIDEIKRRLDTIFERNTVNTERIARTEVLNAMNAGRQSAYEASGVVKYKQWRAAMKNARTAADSKRLNGQIQELENPFIDPKTGDSFMHPPNRPNCRCTSIPLRKLPPNIVRKGGQMYNADEMVGKIEFDIGLLQKAEKRIWIKATAKRKGHYRKIKGAKKVEEVDLTSYIDSLSKTQDGKKRVEDTKHYISGGFGTFNEYLRGGMEGTISEFDEKIKNIGGFLSGAPKFGAIVYRGMFFDERTRGSTDIMDTFLDNLEVGGDVEMVAFTSTTKDRNKAIEFTGGCDKPEDCTRILFEIKSKNGVDVETMSKFGHEQEVLFDRNATFVVKSMIHEPPNNVNIRMEEV